MRRPFFIALPLLSGLALLTAPGPARACGGTFCDPQPAVPMPVDQTGENILFVVEGGHVQAHIQIQYEGDPERFAWVIPVTAIPEVRPGSDRLFQNLLETTVPSFLLDSRTEGECRPGPSTGCGDFASDSAAGSGRGEGDLGGGITEQDGAEVVARGLAGSFEYAVLKGETVEEVIEWLDDNDYEQDEDAPPILADYLEEGFLFVAVKLRSGAGVEEIHPLVLDYEGDEPCVPIRLTRIAAKEDMGIRLFFLGDARWVPTNFAHVELNWARLDWTRPTASYPELVTLAVDDEAAGGHGFVTEYAGDLDPTITSGLRSDAWDADAFLDLDPGQVVPELEHQGLLDCGTGSGQGCQVLHPLVPGLLDRYLPVPPGVDANDFYPCVECYEDLVDQEAWSGPGFAVDLQAQIVDPGDHADALVREHDVLTRMFTTISPHEMTEDPIFHPNPDLPEVDNLHVATTVSHCRDRWPDYLELEDGRRVFGGPGSAEVVESLPAAERIERVPMAGAPQVQMDHGPEIDRALDDHNAQHEGDGCSCRTSRVPWQGVAFLGTIFALAWPRRRRRRAR